MIKWILIGSFILKFVYDKALSHINDRHLAGELPDNVKDIYDEQEYKRWQSYHAENSRLSLMESSLQLVIELLFLGLNLYAAIFGLFAGMNLYLSYFLFILVSLVITTTVSVGFHYYDTFVIEEKYGLNKTTKKTFVLDEIKGFLIGLLLMFVILAILAFFFERYGNAAIIFASIAVFAFSIAIALAVMPIMRIFNKFEPLPEGELKRSLTALCQKYGIEVKRIVVKDASRRTTTANAFCTGLTKKKTISLDDNLINEYEVRQIVAVFAHEFAHAKGKHVLKSLPFSAFRTVLTVAATGVILNFPVLFAAFGFEDVNYLFAMTLVSMITWPAAELLDFIGNSISRKHEYEADAFAAREGYGEDLIAALKKLSKEALSSINPHPLIVALHYSHPTLSQRFAAIEKETQHGIKTV